VSETGERHASWLELFFDLVVVVAVARLAHGLHEPTWGAVALFVLFYYAVWSVWTSLTLHSNVRADKTRVRSMLIGMYARRFRAYIALPAHFAITAGITALAAGLGVVVTEHSEHLDAGIAWVLCGGLAAPLWRIAYRTSRRLRSAGPMSEGAA
jgi:low temperature requirement protein LtrA